MSRPTLGETIVRARYEALADEYDATIGARRAVYNAAVDARVLAALRGRSGLTLLDAGCGSASRPAAMKQKLPGARIVGVDASASMIAIARTRGLDDARVGRLDALDFPDRTFGAVTCLFFVVCYLTTDAERARAAAELYRVLEPGGLLFVDAVNLLHLGEGLTFRRTLREVAIDYARSILDPRLGAGDRLYETRHGEARLAGFFHPFTHASLTRLFRGAGFRVKERLTLGYETGRPRLSPLRGQLFHVYQRPEAR